MTRYTTGNLLEAKAEALVNTVNTVGIMGKGIALMFREAFAENCSAYVAACKKGEVRVGQMFVTERQAVFGPRWIINFPTKQDWRSKTRLTWVVDGLMDLRRVIVGNSIQSIALPPLGCGNGGLDWSVVRPKIEEALGDLADIAVKAGLSRWPGGTPAGQRKLALFDDRLIELALKRLAMPMTA
jgi:O-acetyl-ADP-ribose deacetylase (regulator of RNase III)